MAGPGVVVQNNTQLIIWNIVYQVWMPYRKKDVDMLESAQGRATRTETKT